MGFGTARTTTAPAAGAFGSARVVSAPAAGQFGAVSGAWTPASLDAGNLRAWYSMQEASTRFQDSALTTAAGDTDPLGGWTDASGAMEALIQATAGNRPTIGSSGGLLYASFDGAGDILQGATASAWKALHGSLGGGIYMVAEWTGTGTNADGIGTFAGASTASIGIRLRLNTSLGRMNAYIADGTNQANAQTTTGGFPTGTKRVVMAINDAPNTNIIARAWPNAAVTATSSGVTYSSSDGAALKVTMGTSVLRVYELVARSPVLASEELTELLAYWNGIYGIDP